MKQRDLVKKLEDSGFVFERHGSNHDIYTRGEEKEEVPRNWWKIGKSYHKKKKTLIY